METRSRSSQSKTVGLGTHRSGLAFLRRGWMQAPKTISAQNEEGEAMSEAFRKTIPTYWGT